MFSDSPDPIPGAVRQLVELFESHLAEVPFPDVDLGSLQVHIEAVEARAEAVERCKAELAAAREALDGARQELVRHAEKGVAYARIYAQGRPELGERLKALELSRPGPDAVAKPRRGRRKKEESAVVPQLPMNEPRKRISAAG